ncbi:hypothetical protein AX17_005973 [Amanita inopinata Kibby_2008]|nr:hypothetical protein AX17_005973 [Amanita inopinata Kibby_2008]
MDPVTFYGFTSVVRDPDLLFHEHPTASGDHPKQDPFKAEDFPVPDTELAREETLDEQTFNHSNRVYIYGVALTKTHFPSWSYDLETYYLTCLMHDIGTAKRFLATTKMSFEFKGGIVARDLILKLGGIEDQADSVCDAIIRHQDLFIKGGNITMIGQILQLATVLDNTGIRANLIHPSLIKSTCAAFPRKGWCTHFANVIETELKLKPWCHTTVFEEPHWKEGVKSNFATAIRENTIMHPFD